MDPADVASDSKQEDPGEQDSVSGTTEAVETPLPTTTVSASATSSSSSSFSSFSCYSKDLLRDPLPGSVVALRGAKETKIDTVSTFRQGLEKGLPEVVESSDGKSGNVFGFSAQLGGSSSSAGGGEETAKSASYVAEEVEPAAGEEEEEEMIESASRIVSSTSSSSSSSHLVGGISRETTSELKLVTDLLRTEEAGDRPGQSKEVEKEDVLEVEEKKVEEEEEEEEDERGGEHNVVVVDVAAGGVYAQAGNAPIGDEEEKEMSPKQDYELDKIQEEGGEPCETKESQEEEEEEPGEIEEGNGRTSNKKDIETESDICCDDSAREVIKDSCNNSLTVASASARSSHDSLSGDKTSQDEETMDQMVIMGVVEEENVPEEKKEMEEEEEGDQTEEEADTETEPMDGVESCGGEDDQVAMEVDQPQKDICIHEQEMGVAVAEAEEDTEAEETETEIKKDVINEDGTNTALLESKDSTHPIVDLSSSLLLSSEQDLEETYSAINIPTPPLISSSSSTDTTITTSHSSSAQSPSLDPPTVTSPPPSQPTSELHLTSPPSPSISQTDSTPVSSEVVPHVPTSTSSLTTSQASTVSSLESVAGASNSQLTFSPPPGTSLTFHHQTPIVSSSSLSTGSLCNQPTPDSTHPSPPAETHTHSSSPSSLSTTTTTTTTTTSQSNTLDSLPTTTTTTTLSTTSLSPCDTLTPSTKELSTTTTTTTTTLTQSPGSQPTSTLSPPLTTSQPSLATLVSDSGGGPSISSPDDEKALMRHTEDPNEEDEEQEEVEMEGDNNEDAVVSLFQETNELLSNETKEEGKDKEVEEMDMEKEVEDMEVARNDEATFSMRTEETNEIKEEIEEGVMEPSVSESKETMKTYQQTTQHEVVSSETIPTASKESTTMASSGISSTTTTSDGERIEDNSAVNKGENEEKHTILENSEEVTILEPNEPSIECIIAKEHTPSEEERSGEISTANISEVAVVEQKVEYEDDDERQTANEGEREKEEEKEEEEEDGSAPLSISEIYEELEGETGKEESALDISRDITLDEKESTGELTASEGELVSIQSGFGDPEFSITADTIADDNDEEKVDKDTAVGEVSQQVTETCDSAIERGATQHTPHLLITTTNETNEEGNGEKVEDIPAEGKEEEDKADLEDIATTVSDIAKKEEEEEEEEDEDAQVDETVGTKITLEQSESRGDTTGDTSPLDSLSQITDKPEAEAKMETAEIVQGVSNLEKSEVDERNTLPQEKEEGSTSSAQPSSELPKVQSSEDQVVVDSENVTIDASSQLEQLEKAEGEETNNSTHPAMEEEEEEEETENSTHPAMEEEEETRNSTHPAMEEEEETENSTHPAMEEEEETRNSTHPAMEEEEETENSTHPAMEEEEETENSTHPAMEEEEETENSTHPAVEEEEETRNSTHPAMEEEEETENSTHPAMEEEEETENSTCPAMEEEEETKNSTHPAVEEEEEETITPEQPSTEPTQQLTITETTVELNDEEKKGREVPTEVSLMDAPSMPSVGYSDEQSSQSSVMERKEESSLETPNTNKSETTLPVAVSPDEQPKSEEEEDEDEDDIMEEDEENTSVDIMSSETGPVEVLSLSQSEEGKRVTSDQEKAKSPADLTNQQVPSAPPPSLFSSSSGVTSPSLPSLSGRQYMGGVKVIVPSTVTRRRSTDSSSSWSSTSPRLPVLLSQYRRTVSDGSSRPSSTSSSSHTSLQPASSANACMSSEATQTSAPTLPPQLGSETKSSSTQALSGDHMTLATPTETQATPTKQVSRQQSDIIPTTSVIPSATVASVQKLTGSSAPHTHLSSSSSTPTTTSSSSSPFPLTGSPTLPAGYQPVIQVTPNGPVVAFIPASQLKMIQSQQQQQQQLNTTSAAGSLVIPSCVATSTSSTPHKKRSTPSSSSTTTTTNSLSKGKLTGDPANPSILTIPPEKRRVVTVRRPETMKTFALSSSPATQLPHHIQRLSVPQPQTLESTEVVRITTESVVMETPPPKMAAVGSQTEPTSSAGKSQSAADTSSGNRGFKLTITTVPSSPSHSSSSSSSTSSTSLNQDLNTESRAKKTQQVTAQVAHIPVVQIASTGNGEGGRRDVGTEGGGGGGGGGGRVGGVRQAEKLLVQKAEVLGALGVSGQEDFQPRQISTVHCHTTATTTTSTSSSTASVMMMSSSPIMTSSSSSGTPTKTPQVAVIPPLMVEHPKVSSSDTRGDRRPQSDDKDDLSKEDSQGNEKQPPVIRRFWTTSWKPLNVNDLESIGTDSKGNMYWYDGGRNMFQSPPHPDPQHKPREADMQLVCKSMVQWTAKLKELRGTREEQDMKLSQIIKEKFVPRVRRVTQRKPRDPNAIFQMIQSGKSGQQQMTTQQHFQQAFQMIQQQQQGSTVSSSSSSKTTGVATVQSSNGTTQKQSVGQQQQQPSFPQGSILVVPHQHGFQALPFLPVFANTAVIMPQGVTASVPADSTNLSTQLVPSSGGSPQTTGKGETANEKEKEVGVVSAVLKDTTSAKSSSEILGQKGVGDGCESGGGGVLLPSSSSVDRDGVKTEETTEKVKKKAKAAAKSTSTTVPSSILPIYTLSVGDSVKLESFDFRSKSVEISGEVPIRAVTVDEAGKENTISLTQLRELAGDQFGSSTGEVESKSSDTATKTENNTELPTTTTTTSSSLGHEVLKGHTSTEVMSAKMLLSLTGRSSEVSPLEKEPPPKSLTSPAAVDTTAATGVIGRDQSVTSVTSSSSGTLTSSSSSGDLPGSKGARKRKQKPTPSAKPTAADEITQTPKTKTNSSSNKKSTTTPIAANNNSSDKPTPPAAKAKRTKKATPKQTTGNNAKAAPSAEKATTKGPTRPKKGSQKNSSKTGVGQKLSSASPAPSAATREKGGVSGGRSKIKATASARMEQLKAERGSCPVKEFVIESSSGSDSDEESDDSSSGSGSTSFSPNSGSSSDSSSDSSSENQQSVEPRPAPQKPSTGRGRGGGARGRMTGARGGRGVKGRGGGTAPGKGRGKIKSQSSSSDESSGAEEEEEGGGGAKGGRGKKQAAGKTGRGRGQVRAGGRGRGRGRAGRKDSGAGHVVSIPTDLLENVPARKRQRKSEIADYDIERPGDYLPEGPNLASFLSTGDVDLSTLSELTESVPGKDPSSQGVTGTGGSGGGGGGSRSKRTCVRVREGISRLEEILGNGANSSLPSKSNRGRSRGVATVGGEVTAKKPRRPPYRSQFVQKRRRKRRKPEEEALWQPARKVAATDNRRAIYVFSTDMANAAADAVLKNRYDTIIQFHNAQPKRPGFLRLSRKDSGGKMEKTETSLTKTHQSSEDSEDEEQEEEEVEGEEEEEVGGRGATGVRRRGGVGGSRAPKRRSSRLSASEETPTTKKSRGSSGGGGGRMSDNSRQTRFSRRLRRQQHASDGLTPSSQGSGDNSTSEDEEDEEDKEEVGSEVDSTKSPGPGRIARGRGGRRGRGRRGGRRGRGRRGRGRRNSTHITRHDQEDEEEEEEEEERDREGEDESEKEELNMSKNIDRQEEEEEEEEDEEDDDSFEKESAYAKARESHVTLPSMQPSGGGSKPREGEGDEENNYTICHGTPGSKANRDADISSPSRNDSPLISSSHRRSTMSPARRGGGGASSLAAAHHTQHNIASMGVLPDNRAPPVSSVGGGPVGLSRGDPMVGGASAIHSGPSAHHKETGVPTGGGGSGDGAGGGGRGTPANNWASQFAHVPGGYYGAAGIHPMHYPPHPAAPHVPGANYSPYGVYPWGTPHHVGGHPQSRGEQQQHVYGGHQQHEGHQPHRPLPPSSSHHPHQQGGNSITHHRLSSTAADISKDSQGGSSGGGASSSHEGTPTHDKPPPQLPQPPPHPLSSPHPASHRHPGPPLPHHPGAVAAQQAFHRPPHPALANPEQLSVHPAAAAAFSYSFDPHMHSLWQQQQMRAAAGVHPSHLPPHLQHAATAAGMWYPHMQGLIQPGGSPRPPQQQQAGGAAANKHPATVDALRLNTNRNNSTPVGAETLVLHPFSVPTTTPLPSFQQALLPPGATQFGSNSREWTRRNTRVNQDNNSTRDVTETYCRR